MTPTTSRKFMFLTGILVMASSQVMAATFSGQILDINGNPVNGAMVTIEPSWPGPTAITAFSDTAGSFSFPEQDNYRFGSDFNVTLRALGYELVDSSTAADGDAVTLTVIAKVSDNQAASAPASAWLQGKADHDSTSRFVLDCVGCHQVPSTEFRNYAAAIADIPGTDRADIRRQSYDALVKYMNFLSAEEFGRGPDAAPPDASRVYEVGDGPRVIDFLSEHFTDRMDAVSGYDWGAPLAVTPDTAILEYEVPRPNAIREALLLGEPKQLWVADVASNAIFRIDPESGYTTSLDVPADIPVGPHSLHRGADGSLWMAPFITSVVGQLDVNNDTWRTWRMETVNGTPTGIHDLSFGADHTLLADRDGLVWFSDIVNNAVGYLDPYTGAIDHFMAPAIPGRPTTGTALYGLVMNADRDEIWFSQLNIGSIGSFNVVTREFGPSFQLPMNSGPRRLTISDDDILYVPLYGTGQLVEYDTKTNTLIGIYDMPDLASAPYAVTWDPVRKVVWIPTSNTDVIYKFDPADKSISVLPMPRQGAFLRMVDIDPDTGNLITSYANIVEHVHGPRMALIIDPGDGAYR
jgi:streptogramin lyase